MTTIIFVAIGVLMAALAALMVIFYGGDAFTASDTKAEAARLITEGAQMEHAVKLYVAQEGKMPGNGTGVDQEAIDDLVDKEYLTQVPKGGTMDPNKWQVDYDLGVVRSEVGPVTDERAVEVCLAARRQLSLPDAATATGVYKCDGSDAPGGALSTREPCCVYSN